MPDPDAQTYREREKHWRNEAARLTSGQDRDACLALADGYADLVSIIERRDIFQEAPERLKAETSGSPTPSHQ
jgi:hypothetical protein